MLKITQVLKKRYPKIPVIVFPRGVGGGYVQFSKNKVFSGLALDQSVPISWAKQLQKDIIIQGNLDPIHLITGGNKLKSEIELLLAAIFVGVLLITN